MTWQLRGRILLAVAAAQIGLACGPGPDVPGSTPQAETVAETSALSSSPWTKIVQGYPGSAPGPSNLALLTDGTVLASAQGTDNRWFRLTPTTGGSYANGGWSILPSSNMGRLFAQSYVLKDGKYFICGGEYVSDNYESATHAAGQARARCELFDPVTGMWSNADDMPETMADTPAVLLASGIVLGLSYATSGAWLYTEGATPNWVPAPSYDRNTIGTEGDCIPLQDGTVFCGYSHYTKYIPGSPFGWSPVAQDPPVSFLSSPANFAPEVGPFVLLYDGRVLVLGANSNNKTGKNADSGFFDNGSGHWTLAPAMPSHSPPFNHGDTPAAVMRDGRVLVTSTTADDGAGGTTAVLHEFDPANATTPWVAVPSPPNTTFANGPYLRMLDLPNGQVLVTGTNDKSMWLYTPNGSPVGSARPLITQMAGPVAAEFKLAGQRLNGLTTGANFGDDNRSATNYPIVFLTDTLGHVYYARSYAFSQMAPISGQTTTTCKFTLPTAIPNGSYQVHVSANGLDSSNTVPLTVSGIHVSALNLTSPTQASVVLSAPAPTGGTVVLLQSSDPGAISVPSSITIPAGSTTRSFVGTVNAMGTALISASTSPANSAFKAATARMGWTVQVVSGLSNIYGDRAAAPSLTWALAINPAAPSGGAVVQLASSDTNVATVPASVTVPAGTVSVAFQVTRAPFAGLATISASVRNSTATYTFSNRDMDFFKCADEGGTCASTLGTRYIAFGANGHYIYKTSFQPLTDCSTSFFGDIDVGGAPRACYLGVYGWAADEGGSISLADSRDVAYGAATGFIYQRMNAGNFTCNGATFGGDPAPGASKSCFLGPDMNAYVYAGDEGTTISGLTAQPVAYGGGGHFAFGIFSGSIGCDNGTFGDPSVNYFKACYKLKYGSFIGVEGQGLPLSTSIVLYGSGLNGNFMWETVGSPAFCTNAYFGGDPDVGQLKRCWAP